MVIVVDFRTQAKNHLYKIDLDTGITLISRATLDY
jgi:hypothetical protein